jgi:CRP-like cAMP-binding protein
VSGKGKEAVLAIIGPGQFFGMRNLFDDQHRFATTTALTRCSVLRIGKSAILRALREEPRFAEAFVFFLLDAIGRVEVSLLDQLLNSSEQRLARILLHLADPDGEGRFEPISPEISQQTLAEMVGTTRARINSFMNKFRRLGLIDYNGHLEVREALRKFVQE